MTEDFAQIVVNPIFDPFQISWFQRTEIGSILVPFFQLLLTFNASFTERIPKMELFASIYFTTSRQTSLYHEERKYHWLEEMFHAIMTERR